MRRKMTIHEAALAVVRHLRQNGHEAYWAGGSVRDMLLNRDPEDIDVATEAPPERIIELFSRTRKVGAKFGVVMVQQGTHWIETATFRTDTDYQDGRRPVSVEFTTAEHDAQRRDFTINGLFYDPIEEKVIDYVGGQSDLDAGVIRAIGDPGQRFAEDHLRMLRAVRFATRFGFEIEPATAEAIGQQAGKITRISPERIHEELEKMLGHRSRAKAVEEIARHGLLEHLWPGSHWPADRLQRALGVIGALPEDVDFVSVMAALLHELSVDVAKKICRELRCSNRQIDDTGWLIENRNRFDEAKSMSLAEFKKLLAHPRADDLLALYKAICESQNKSLDVYVAVGQRRDSIPPAEVAPLPLVTGEDLIELGLEPGPQFKQILDKLYDAQLNNELITRRQAIEQMKTYINRQH
ncbi:MAG: CCA tRNA nucleotidyltransferase [Planctomycetota bacterium]|nr:MAG: CCA tRNA nucleotidyltransferase [Planctomycetota bacterium]